MTGNENQLRLRHTFVSMLFALTAGQIAVLFGEVVNIYYIGNPPIESLLSAILHLFVSLILVTTSWVGWSVATSANSEMQLKHVFHIPYIVLLIDIALVILYFSVVNSVEIVFYKDPILLEKGIHAKFSPPSSVQEITLILIVFGIYFVWDIVHSVLPNAKFSNWFRLLIAKTLPSGVSFMLLLFIFMIYKEENSFKDVIISNIALLSIIFGFRALKGIEGPAARFLELETDIVPTRSREYNWIAYSIICGVIYLVCFVCLY